MKGSPEILLCAVREAWSLPPANLGLLSRGPDLKDTESSSEMIWLKHRCNDGLTDTNCNCLIAAGSGVGGV